MLGRIITVAFLLFTLACGTEDEPLRESSPAAFANTVFLLETKMPQYMARGLPAADATGYIDFNRFIEIGALHYQDLHGYSIEFYRCNPGDLTLGQNEQAICIVAALPLSAACQTELALDDSSYTTGKGRSPAGSAYSDFSDCTTHLGQMDYIYRVYL